MRNAKLIVHSSNISEYEKAHIFIKCLKGSWNIYLSSLSIIFILNKLYLQWSNTLNTRKFLLINNRNFSEMSYLEIVRNHETQDTGEIVQGVKVEYGGW